jgi:zinc protease
MHLQFRKSALSICLGAVVAMSALRAQAPAGTQSVNGQEVIPFDAAVHTGTLPNGLRYYMRENQRPAARVSLRLAVKAGSLDERDDQQGLAHFIEHMAFNGSAHFKPGELVSYFESIGSRLGPHVNAYTGFEETVYQLELPTDRPEIVAKGLTAFADFAGGLTFIPEEVEKERGVVIEEWRNGLGAGSRIRDRQIPVLFYKSRYAERLPIGKPDIIRTAPASRLREFYDAWYRPESMAVVAVGHIDPKQFEAAIRTTFGPLKARAPKMARADSAVPAHSELLVNVTADPEVTSSTVQLLRKRPRQGERLVEDYRRNLVARMFERMFNQRLDELGRKPEAAFLSGGGGDSPLGRTLEAFTLSARVKDGGIDEGLAALEIEARRVRDFGFTAQEFTLARRAMMSFYQRAVDEKDKTESTQLANEYIRNFLIDEPSPGIEYEYRLVQRLMGAITIDEITAVARTLLADTSRVVLATAPQKPGLPMPGEAEIRAALAAADKVAVMPPTFSEMAVPSELMPDKPPPAAVVTTRELRGIGVTVVTFANGVQAWLKPTDFKNDQVIFSLSAPGGTSLAPPAEFANASMATGYIRLSGFKGLKALDLQKMLTGSSVAVAPSMTPTNQTIAGSVSPNGLETALQALYLTFTAPGDDPEAFALLKRQLDAGVANRGQNPAQVFGERLAQVVTSNHYISQPLTAETVAGLDRTKMIAFYRARFSNAADFTFFMVGAFKPDDVVPLLARYVGSLPSTGKHTSEVKDLGIQFPATIQRVQVDKGREPRAQVALSFFAEPPMDAAEQEKVSVATAVLQTTLREVLRENLGQTYGVSVGLAQMLGQRGGGHIRVSFAGSPENVSSMTDRVLQQVKLLRDQPPPATLVATVKETFRRQNETSLKENAYWLVRLQTLQRLGKDPSEILTTSARIDAITPASVQETFRKYFPLDRYTVVTLIPEKP